MKALFVPVFALGFMISISSAGKIRLEPATGEFVAECPFEVDIMIDTE